MLRHTLIAGRDPLSASSDSDTRRRERSRRRRLLTGLVGVTAGFSLLLARFWHLQVVRHPEFHAQAENNRITLVPSPPNRGEILDRNGVVLATNRWAYALEIAPGRVLDLNATLRRLGEVIEITPGERRRFLRVVADAKATDTIPLKVRLSDTEVARIAAARFQFPGVEVRARPYRHYPFTTTVAHLVGHIGRISPQDEAQIELRGERTAYRGISHIGKMGVEQSYEKALRGNSGVAQVEISASGRAVRALDTTAPQTGRTVRLTVDIRLQKLIEEWYGERRGAMVAIEPASGEILAMVSKPGFDPNLFIDVIEPKTWNTLINDPDRPLLNRPLRGTYPPGSTYKPFMALAVLKTGVRSRTRAISDPGYFQLGNHRFRDSKKEGHGRVNLYKAVVVSSDTYFYGAAHEMGVDRIHDFMKPWGFGQRTGVDLPEEVTGVLPSRAWKLKRFKQPWFPGETPSIGIGQGYDAFTILQLAHAVATLANGGVKRTPHVGKAMIDPGTGSETPLPWGDGARLDVEADDLDFVRKAMVDVNTSGTGRGAFRGATYSVAGKTGTAQVIGIAQDAEYDAKKIDERHRDHSLYICFAPADAPRIAMAIIMENAGFGSQAAAPLARKVLDYHLLGRLPEGQAPPLEEPDMPEDIPPPPELTPDESGSAPPGPDSTAAPPTARPAAGRV